MIMNASPSDQPGTHWLLFAQAGGQIFFADPLGKRFCLIHVFCNVIHTFCLIHVFAIEHTLLENLVKTGEFRRKIVSIERTICWQR